MVKGNKFKTAAFLEKQAFKLQSKPPTAAITASQQQPVAACDISQQAQLKLCPPAVDPLHGSSQLQTAKAGNKRKRCKGALAEVVNACMPVAAQQTAHIVKKQQKVMAHASIPPPKASIPPPKTASNAPNPKKQKRSQPAVPTILAAPAPQGKAVNSNWAALKGVVTSKTSRIRQAVNGSPAADRPPVLKAPQQKGPRMGLTPVVALDCEMVGVGPDGTRSALARWVLLLCKTVSQSSPFLCCAT